MAERQSTDERNVAINGAGVIGTNILRKLAQVEADGNQESMPVSHIVDGWQTRGKIIDALNNDPIRGPIAIPAEKGLGNTIRIGDQTIQFVKDDLTQMKENFWKNKDVWGVIEASGPRTAASDAYEHRERGGAEKILVTAPVKGFDTKDQNPYLQSLVMGFNESEYDPEMHHVLSNESCTTKSGLHALDVLDKDLYGVDDLSLTTVHAETGGERRDLINNKGKIQHWPDNNFRPQPTGAQGALSRLFPKTNVSARAFRVPTAENSSSDITYNLSSPGSAAEILNYLRVRASAQNGMGTIEVVNGTNFTSADLLNNEHDSVILANTVDTIGAASRGNLVRLVSGYDNGYAPAGAAYNAMEYVRAQP